MLSWFQLSPMEWDAIHLSMSVALSSMLWSLPFAIFIAWLLARKEFYGKSLITGIIHLPLVDVYKRQRMTLGYAMREEQGVWQDSLGLDSSYGLKGQLVGAVNQFFTALNLSLIHIWKI